MPKTPPPPTCSPPPRPITHIVGRIPNYESGPCLSMRLAMWEDSQRRPALDAVSGPSPSEDPAPARQTPAEPAEPAPAPADLDSESVAGEEDPGAALDQADDEPPARPDAGPASKP